MSWKDDAAAHAAEEDPREPRQHGLERGERRGVEYRHAADHIWVARGEAERLYAAAFDRGDSLLATKVAVRVLKELKVEVPLEMLFRSPTICWTCRAPSRPRANG